jgi:hypothetical protein
MNKKMIEIISPLRIWNGHTKTFIAKQIHLSKLPKQHQNGTSFLLKFEKAWCDKRYIYEIQQGNMRWIRVKSRQKIHMHTSMCGAAIPMLADACLTKRLNLGFSDFDAGPPSDPNSLNLRVHRSANHKRND